MYESRGGGRKGGEERRGEEADLHLKSNNPTLTGGEEPKEPETPKNPKTLKH